MILKCISDPFYGMLNSQKREIITVAVNYITANVEALSTTSKKNWDSTYQKTSRRYVIKSWQSEYFTQ